MSNGVELNRMINPDDLEDQELGSASSKAFDDATQGLRSFFKGGMAVCEAVHDRSAALFGFFLGESVVENHTQNLEAEAKKALADGNREGAKHFLKRDIAFTGWTQGYNDEDTQRLLKELDLVEHGQPIDSPSISDLDKKIAEDLAASFLKSTAKKQ